MATGGYSEQNTALAGRGVIPVLGEAIGLAPALHGRYLLRIAERTGDMLELCARSEPAMAKWAAHFELGLERIERPKRGIRSSSCCGVFAPVLLFFRVSGRFWFLSSGCARLR